MARKPRGHHPGAVSHVILRGKGQEDIFGYEGDQGLAQRLDEDISSLSAAATRLERRVHEDTELKWKVAQLSAKLQIT